MSLQRQLRRVAAASFLAFVTSPANAQSAPFSGFAGSWSGNGSISMSDGSKERLRCRAMYRVSLDGATLRQTLRCASDSYKFELISDVFSEGGRLSGSWTEASRGISGSLQGSAQGSRMTATVDAPGFNANLALATSGNRQSISITSEGDIRNVSVSMTKG